MYLSLRHLEVTYLLDNLLGGKRLILSSFSKLGSISYESVELKPRAKIKIILSSCTYLYNNYATILFNKGRDINKDYSINNNV